MGDRVSISFVNEKQPYAKESVALFSHWDGMNFVAQADDYVKELKAELAIRSGAVIMPLDRLEPNTVMVDFIRWYVARNIGGRVTSNLYLGADPDAGDNSDNGHHRIVL